MVATEGTLCQATVTQWKNGIFTVNRDRPHIHSPAAGALTIARIKSRIRKEVAADLVKPVSLIVRQVLQEELTKTPCTSQPQRRNLYGWQRGFVKSYDQRTCRKDLSASDKYQPTAPLEPLILTKSINQHPMYAVVATVVTSGFLLPVVVT